MLKDKETGFEMPLNWIIKPKSIWRKIKVPVDATLMHALTHQKNLLQYETHYVEGIRHFQYTARILKFCSLIDSSVRGVYESQIYKGDPGTCDIFIPP